MGLLSKISEAAEVPEAGRLEPLTIEEDLLIKLHELQNSAIELSAEQTLDSWVAEYLQRHPRFFEGKENLLKSMLLSHPQTGVTISLLERQLAVLRTNSDDFASKVTSYEDHAVANAETFAKIEHFSAALMKTQTPQDAVDCIYEQMQVLFGVDETSLHSFELPNQSLDGLKQLGMSHRWEQALLATLRVNKPVCGPIEADWRSGLFYQHDNIASVCVVPLGEDRLWGALALGSVEMKFIGNETVFLKFIGKLVTAKLDSLFHREL